MNTLTEQKQNTPSVDSVVSKESLEDLNVNSLLVETNKVDCFSIYSRLNELFETIKSSKVAPLQLLTDLTSCHVEPDNPVKPFKPMWIVDGKRSLIPSDLCSEQFDEIAEFVPSVSNRGLKARLADVVWFMQRRRRDMAAFAIESYCDCIKQVRARESEFRHADSPCGVYARQYIVRAACISRVTKWKLESSNQLKILVRELVLSAYENSQFDDFVRIAQVAVDYTMIPCADILEWVKELVIKEELSDNPDVRIRLWEIAARCRRIDRNDDGYNNCMEEISECYVQKANHADSSMLAATFFEDAIQALINLPKTKERRNELNNHLREAQLKIHDEMKSFSVETDLTEIVNQSISSVHNKQWLEAFLALVMCDVPPKPDKIRNDAKEQIKNAPLQGFMPKVIHDFQGRTTYKSSGVDFQGSDEDNEESFRFAMSQSRDISRSITVSGCIEPIRSTIVNEHPVSVELIMEMIKDSIFIPSGHEYIYAKGVMHFLSGDYMEAAHLLIPQLENSLRHILSENGINTTAIDKDGIQTEASLSILLNPEHMWRKELEEIISVEHIYEMDLLFHFPGGPSLRNQMAHGKVPTDYFLTHTPAYAAWFIMHVALLPLTRRWGDIVSAYASVKGVVKPSDSDSDDSE